MTLEEKAVEYAKNLKARDFIAKPKEIVAYFAYLTGVEEVKADCDFALEGKEIEIRELEQENNKLLDVINNQDVKIADLEKQNKELDRALITSTKNNIERQEIIDSLQAEKEKEEMQNIAKCSDREEGLRRKIFKLEEQIEKMRCCLNCAFWKGKKFNVCRDIKKLGKTCCTFWKLKE